MNSEEYFFTEESIYWEPESDTTSLYEQLAKRKYREISRQFIRQVIQVTSYPHIHVITII